MNHDIRDSKLHRSRDICAISPVIYLLDNNLINKKEFADGNNGVNNVIMTRKLDSDEVDYFTYPSLIVILNSLKFFDFTLAHTYLYITKWCLILMIIIKKKGHDY